MVIKDIEREDIEFVCKTLGCRPIASLDHFTAENLVNVDLVEEMNEPIGKYIKVSYHCLVVNWDIQVTLKEHCTCLALDGMSPVSLSKFFFYFNT